MGVDIRLYLYQATSPEDLAKALAILAGNPHNPRFVGYGPGKPEPEYVRFVNPPYGFFVASPEVTLQGVGFTFPLGSIDFSAPADKQSPYHSCTIHLTNEHPGFIWTIIPPSTPFWIAAARKIVDLFGGALDYNDCDLSEIDYFRFERKFGKDPANDAYVAKQKAILELDALTGEEIEACRQFAAYDDIESYL